MAPVGICIPEYTPANPLLWLAFIKALKALFASLLNGKLKIALAKLVSVFKSACYILTL